MLCRQGGRQRQQPGCSDSWHHRLVLGMWNVTPLAGKEPQLVWEVELDLVGPGRRTVDQFFTLAGLWFMVESGAGGIVCIVFMCFVEL